METNKEDIATLMDSILESARIENKAVYEAIAHNDTVKRALDYAQQGNAHYFYLSFIRPFKNILGVLIAEATTDPNVAFILRHYDFLKRHFEKILVKYEGLSYAADKSKHIIKCLMLFYFRGEEINFDYSNEYVYHLPDRVFKTQAEILEFFEGLHALYYGSPEKFLTTLMVMAKNKP